MPNTSPTKVFPYAIALCLMGLLFLALAVGVRYHDQAKVNEVADENHRVLCAFKNDRVTAARNTREYIADIKAHRRPPIRGITAADLQRSLMSIESTLKVLRELDCP